MRGLRVGNTGDNDQIWGFAGLFSLYKQLNEKCFFLKKIYCAFFA